MFVKYEPLKPTVLKKKRARNTILFISDKEDDWFVNIIHFASKSGIELRRATIIRKDVDGWIKYYEGQGWEVKLDVPTPDVKPPKPTATKSTTKKTTSRKKKDEDVIPDDLPY